MKRNIYLLVAIAFISLSAISCKDKTNKAETSEAKEVVEASENASLYNADATKSVIHWTGSKPAGKHTGTLHLFSGSIAVVNRDVQSGEFVINMNSLTNTDMDGDGKASLESHLKGLEDDSKKDFFNVTDYPTAKFELTNVTGEGGKVMVNGNLTIKNITQNIEFPATVSFPGDTMFLKSDSFTIDRTKWGVNFMSKTIFSDLKDKFIDDDIELTIELHANKA